MLNGAGRSEGTSFVFKRTYDQQFRDRLARFLKEKRKRVQFFYCVGNEIFSGL
jgi:hypothetical protein